MNRQEFYKYYGEILVEFTHYYKHLFHYEALIPSGKIVVSVGGDSDSIYRHEVTANTYYTINSLDVEQARVYDLNGNVSNRYN